jgi:hypothetical protein
MDNKDLMTKIKFIGKIKIGDKINTRQYLTLQPNSFYTKISRTIILQDSRTNALQFISETIKDAILYLDKLCLQNSVTDQILVKTIIKDMKNAQIGIKNLAETYISDHIIISELETVVQTIEFKLDEIMIKYKITLKESTEDFYSNSKPININNQNYNLSRNNSQPNSQTNSQPNSPITPNPTPSTSYIQNNIENHYNIKNDENNENKAILDSQDIAINMDDLNLNLN